MRYTLPLIAAQQPQTNWACSSRFDALPPPPTSFSECASEMMVETSVMAPDTPEESTNETSTSGRAEPGEIGQRG